MSRILTVTDDLDVEVAVRNAVRQHNDTLVPCRTEVVQDVNQPLGRFDIVLADLRSAAGQESVICHELCSDRRLADAPVVALITARQAGGFRVTWGCDDLIVWPATPEDIRNRLRLTLHRAGRLNPGRSLTIGDVTIDFERYEIRLAGAAVELTFKEYELFRFLATHPGKVFTRESLLDQVWGYDYYGGARTVDVHIRRLRSKLELDGRQFIETVRNVGYRFIELYP